MMMAKKELKFTLCILLFSVKILNAQVKIADNPSTTMNANSVLEIESTNKGLLIPRMAINDLNSATPLTAPVPEGMLVYSDGGSVTDGFYYWNGSAWKKFVQITVQVSEGGTGLTTLGGTNTVLYTSAADAIASVAQSSAAGQFLQTTTLGSAPTWKTVLSVHNGGTGSSTQNFVDLTTDQTAAGAKTWSGLGTFNAGIASTGGAVNLNASSNNTTDINSGTSTGDVTIGGSAAQTLNIGNNAAGQKTIGIGNAVANSSVSILSGGTGTIGLKSALTAAVDINVGTGTATPVNIGTGSTTGTLTFGGTATQSLNFGNGVGVKTIDIGSGISGNTVSLVNGANTTAQTLNLANGASAANTTVNILSGTGTAGAGTLAMANNTRVTTVDLANVSPAAARTTTIAGGSSGVIDVVNIGTGAATVADGKTINIGTTAPTGSGTSSITIGAAGTNDGMGVRFGNARLTINKPLGFVSVGNSNISPTVTQILDAGIFVCSPTGGKNFTFPTAQGVGGLVQSLPGTPAVGDVFTFLISNNGSATLSLVAGTGGTRRGNATVIASENRVIYIRVTSVTAGAETIDIF